jgi:septation ring formation regulator EzrA
MTDEHLQRIRVLEAQVEGNREVVAALHELEANLIAQIDDSAEETMGLVENVLTGMEALRESLHRLERKLDALATSCNRNDEPSDRAA